MSQRQTGKVGVDPPVQNAIRRYFPQYPEGTRGQTLADPNAYLLASILHQLEGEEPADFDLDESDQQGRYFAEKYTVTASGPKQGGQVPKEVDGAKIELGESYDAVDLRFTDAVTVAFKGPNSDHRTIEYRAEDSPVVGRPAQSAAMWVTRGETASIDPTLWMEAYNDGE